MSSRGDISAALVVLSPDAVLAGELSAQLAGAMAIVAVSSPYEAAAEILTGGAAVLLADLRLIRGGHGELLEIARRRKVAMLGVGALPVGFTADDLAGLTLVKRADLGRYVREALARSGEGTAPTPPAERTAQAPAPQAQAAPPKPDHSAAAAGQAQAPQPPEPPPTELKDEALLSLLEGRQEAPFERGLEQEMRFELEIPQAPAAPAVGQPAKQAAPVPTPLAPAVQAPPPGPPLDRGLLSPEELDALLRGD